MQRLVVLLLLGLAHLKQGRDLRYLGGSLFEYLIERRRTTTMVADEHGEGAGEGRRGDYLLLMPILPRMWFPLIKCRVHRYAACQTQHLLLGINTCRFRPEWLGS